MDAKDKVELRSTVVAWKREGERTKKKRYHVDKVETMSESNEKKDKNQQERLKARTVSLKINSKTMIQLK